MELIIKKNHMIDDVDLVKARWKDLLQETIPLEKIQNFIVTQPIYYIYILYLKVLYF